MADEFDPAADDTDRPDLAPPEIPDPEETAPLPSDSPGAMPELDTLGGVVDEMKRADAPPPLDKPDVGEFEFPAPPRASFADDVKDLVRADKPSVEASPEEFEPPPRPALPAATPTAEHEGGYEPPFKYADFVKEINSLKRADGSPLHPNAIAKMKRAYQRATQGDSGMEAEPGQEYLEIEQRENERSLNQADKARSVIVIDLFRLLVQNANETTRELTQLRDSLLRNRQ